MSLKSWVSSQRERHDKTGGSYSTLSLTLHAAALTYIMVFKHRIMLRNLCGQPMFWLAELLLREGLCWRDLIVPYWWMCPPITMDSPNPKSIPSPYILYGLVKICDYASYLLDTKCLPWLSCIDAVENQSVGIGHILLLPAFLRIWVIEGKKVKIWPLRYFGSSVLNILSLSCLTGWIFWLTLFFILPLFN